MIEQGQTYSFEFNNFRRDFRNREDGEVFLLQAETVEDEWGWLRSFPQDSIGAISLKWEELGKKVSVGFDGFKRVHRNRVGAELFLVELGIAESEWVALAGLPRNEIGTASIVWTARHEKATKVKKPTPYGKFWQELDKRGFHNRPDVRAWIDYEGSDEGEAKDLIRQRLGVEKRSLEASPELVIAALRRYDNMHSAITAAEDARRKTAMEVSA